MDGLISSRQAAARLGVGISTIKRWSDDGALDCVKTEGGHRRFRQSDVERLLRRQQGRLEDEEATVARWIDLLVSDAPLTLVVAELLKERSKHGAWFRVAEYLGRVIEALGKRWQEGTLSVAEEHVASERLTRALAWVGQTLVVSHDAPVCLLLTAEGDEHTLGLSLAELSAREAGWNVAWLGRRTPLSELASYVGHLEPRVVGVSASVFSSDGEALARQYETLVGLAGSHGFALVVGGSGAWPDDVDAERLDDFEQWSQRLRELTERQ